MSAPSSPISVQIWWPPFEFFSFSVLFAFLARARICKQQR